MTTLFTLSWIIITLTFFEKCSGHSLNQSMELLETMLKNYDRRFRPTLNQSQPTLVRISFDLLNINDVDEINSKFSVTGFMSLTWKDEIIQWNIDTNHGIRYLIIPVRDVWHPAFVLTYTHGKLGNPYEDWMNVKVMSDGSAMFYQGDVYRSTCSANVTYYPFDVQICSVVFAAWGLTGEDIKIETSSDYVIGDNLIIHGEWEIIANSSIARYPLDSTVTFKFTLRRKPRYFVVNIILPIILMSFLNILVFALPPQSGERISYSITVLLAITVFLTIVADHLPKASEPTAVLSYYVLVNLFMSALICVFTIISLRIYFKEDSTHMAVWARLVVRLTSCAKPRTQSRHTSETESNALSTHDPYNLSSANSIDFQTEKGPGITWVDVSQSMDKLCMVLFLVVTVVNSTIFMIVVTQQ